MSRQEHRRVVKRQVVWEPSPYEVYGPPEQQVEEVYHWSAPPRSGFVQDASLNSCGACNSRPVYGGENGRVVLNTPAGACFRPNLPSANQCYPRPSGHCPNLSSIPSYGHSPSYNSGAQFVMESAH